jgi:esterase/lipase
MNYTVENDGFFGKKYSPENNKYPNKAIITLSGSDGSFNLACKMAKYFSSIGITSISLAYWKGKGLPNEIVSVPIESVENAVHYLKTQGFEKIGVCGISKGGELALLSGSLLNEINGVIAISPIHVACIGFKGMKEVDKSCWSYKGQDIPYTKGHMNFGEVIKKSVIAREITMDFIYEEVLSKINPNSVISVENINGPVLLVSAANDSMWLSKFSCEKVIERLDSNNFKHQYKHLNYQYASHMLFPFSTIFNRFFKVERQYKIECQKSRIDLSQNIQEWLYVW